MRAMRPPTWLVVVLVGAVLGLVFAGVSTYDFVQHLDRQVHSLHCSFIPGVTHSDPTSGCQVAMMSPYSSIFRTHVWGGIPISLGAMSVSRASRRAMVFSPACSVWAVCSSRCP